MLRQPDAHCLSECMMDTVNLPDTSAIFHGQTGQTVAAAVGASLSSGTMREGWASLVQVRDPWERAETDCMQEIDEPALTKQPLDDLFGKVERAKREWEATVDALPDLVCLIDRNGCVIRANRIVEEWQLGQVRHIKGRLLHELLHPACQNPGCYCAVLIQQSIASAAQDEPLQRETYDPFLKRHVHVHTHPVRSEVDEIASTIVVVVRDVTERKQIEQERERLIADLNAYAHSVAHDLKNPVGVIIGFADMLERDLDTFSRQEIGDLARAITRSGQKLIDIIDDLLLFAQVQNAEVETSPLDMTMVVAEALFRLSHLQAEYHAEISLPDSWPVAVGYAPWVEEVWANYLSNALKYGGRPPRVKIGSD
ncbi:MAG TPA: histidine kinase dimerization/phospho-acceptor domain-containing protein, partial [Anaerolineae bacterium]|nr:histidine kinase dimerization/phospho-acceptor domain-containing protein [Anaerolineae bacterium]